MVRMMSKVRTPSQKLCALVDAGRELVKALQLIDK